MKRLLRITALLSSSSLLEILLNIGKTKAIALLTGPAGIGLMGLFQSLINLIRSLAGVFAGAGVVQAVASLPDADRENLYHALFRYVWRVSLAVSIVLALFSRPLADLFFGRPEQWPELLGFALITPLVFLGVFWRSWLNGLRQINRLARLKIQATSLVVLISIGLTWAFGLNGVYLSALLFPVPMATLAYFHLRKVMHQEIISSGSRATTADAGQRATGMRDTVRQILATGNTLLVSSLLFTFSVLLVKGMINRELGSAALGLFQSSWTLAMVYIEILLVALGMDFFPRLSAAVGKDQDFSPLLSQQLAFSLVLAVPVILAMMLAAPSLLRFLYSSEFVAAENILLWQLLGDFFKIPSWVLGYVLIAHKKLSLSLLIQFLWVAIFSTGTVVLLNRYSLSAAGMAFAMAYAVSALVSLIVVFRHLGYRPNQPARRALIYALAFAIAAGFAVANSHYRRLVLLSAFLISAGISLRWLWRQWHNDSAEIVP